MLLGAIKNFRSIVHSKKGTSYRGRRYQSSFMEELFSLEGKSAIVTGGGTGIGAALALGLARVGAKVVLVGRREAVLKEAVDTMQEKLLQVEGVHEKRVFSVACDISNFQDGNIEKVVREAELLSGLPPTILINNAGVNVRQRQEDLTEQHWKTSLDLMLTAPFFITRAMSDTMRAQNYGRIISIASLQSFCAFPDSIPYAAAKSGTLGLTRALAEAYGEDTNITCNAIAPGYVETELTKAVFADKVRSQKLAEATILKRNSVPGDLVGAAIFLSSPASSYVTGQVLPVDGGFTALGLR